MSPSTLILILAAVAFVMVAETFARHGHVDPTGRSVRRRFRVVVLAVALVATSCGSDATDQASSTVQPTPPPAVDNNDNDNNNDNDAEAGLVDKADDSNTDDSTSTGSNTSSSPPGDTDATAPADEGGLYDAEVQAEEASSAADDRGAAPAPTSFPSDPDAEGLFADAEVAPPPATDPDQARLQDNRFADYGYREFINTDDDPLSTFALDVDTGSYTVARRWLDEGVLPPAAAVRVEEFVNAFDYDYDVPRRGLELTVDGGPSPFDRDNWLVRIGVQAEQLADLERPPVSLTFVVDTSGSMDRDDRLGLVKDSLEILVDELEDDDTVAIVVYSDTAGVILEPTAVRDSRRIYDAIDSLRPGGSTNLESGLREGYDLAREAFREDGINRVIIASDGVANAGITDVDQLGEIIRRDADAGIHLVTIGFGMGNFNDETMEQLADNGDGFYAYIDTLDEAERLFEDELTSTLVTAAIDAKIQVEFDPDVVREYRLIGFENRGVRDSDFRNDTVDAGELGVDHQVTAVYEIELHRDVDIADRGDIGEVFLRWEDPETHEVIEIDEDMDLRDIAPTFEETSVSFQLATVVTAFAEVLRDNPYADAVNLDDVMHEADRVASLVDTDQADELVDLIDIARRLV